MSNTNTTKRKRATRDEMLAKLQAKIAKIQAQQDGTYDPANDTDNPILARVHRMLRARKTALHQAQVIFAGRAGTEKSPSINGIDDQITRLETRLAEKIETRKRVVAHMEALPADIATLEALIEKAKGGEDIEIPDGLYTLESDRTDTQVEADFADNN